MADDQDTANDIDEGGDAPDIDDYGDAGTTTAAAAAVDNPTTTSAADYDDDEPIEDYVVKLVVNEQPDGAISSDLVNAAVTDMNGNIISSNTKLYDSINGYTTALYDELNGNTTAIAGGRRLWGKFVKQKLATERERERKNSKT